MKIVVGITGGIAAYKAPELVRLLKKAGHEVRCAATEHALEFVTRTTLETVSQNSLYCDLFASGRTEHISLKDWGEMLVVAPATANIIGKVAGGIADDALSTLLLAFSGKPVIMAPAMNCEMWAHPAVQRNIEILKSWGIRMVGPEEGELACGVSGVGRMAEPAAIAAAVYAAVQPQQLQGQHWLVTAGPTYERIDSVRFIGNYSSGKMGFALAQALADAGAEVELVTGPTHLNVSTYQRINLHRVESAREMYAAATEAFPRCNGAILSAAVADYRPSECADHKLKKNGNEGMHLDLVQNPDILATLGSMKTSEQTLVGFALETDNEEANAQHKLEKKNLDYIVLNSLRDKGAGFGVDTNKVTIIGRNGSRKESPLMSKQEVAHLIIKTITQ